MSKRRPKPIEPWRDFLTPDEAALIDKADEARKVWQSLKPLRSRIVNEACKRRDGDNHA